MIDVDTASQEAVRNLWICAWIDGKHHPEWAIAWALGIDLAMAVVDVLWDPCAVQQPQWYRDIAGDVQKKKGFWKDREMDNSNHLHQVMVIPRLILSILKGFTHS